MDTKMEAEDQRAKVNDIIPNNEPFLITKGSTGCLLLHGFSSMPEEMRPMGEYLADKGFTVLGARLAGHATHPDDLNHVRWTDWLSDVEDGLAVLSKTCTKRVLIGQSLGGMIALTAAARMQVTAVVALSTPYGTPEGERLIDWLQRWLRPTIHKHVERFPTDHPLYERRELNYPAYPEFPARILSEMDDLGMAMIAALAQVKVPVLLIHSRDDQELAFANMEAIYNHLGSQQKEMLLVEGMDHSLVMDPRREEVFAAVEKFLARLDG
jgi:carboxylesterase